MSEFKGTVLASKLPFLLELSRSFSMIDGAWMLLYMAEASRPAYLWMTVGVN